MFYINKITSSSVIDYAAEELRKYFRMMMPEGGNVEIKYDPFAKDGFRLGLMQDFGLDVSDAEDTELDDIIYIDESDYDKMSKIITSDKQYEIIEKVISLNINNTTIEAPALLYRKIK